MLVKITKQPIDPQEASSSVRHPSCGAVAVFQGEIRNQNEGKNVLGLEYEVYEDFFHAETRRIVREVREKWAIYDIALIQRIGKLDVGEVGVVIAVSSPHRRESLEALSYVIEEFKQRAPVWKKEHYAEAAEWIHC